MTGLDEVTVLQLPKILDARGNLSFLESRKHVPFEIKRVYWIYDVPGGEEFAAILPGINLEAAQRVAERIIENVNNLKIKHPDSSVSEFVTVSIGGAVALPCAESEMTEIIKKADVALYSAKKNGRNRIVLAESAF